MSNRLTLVVLLALVLVGQSVNAAEPEQPADAEPGPLDSSLVERTERRLVQLDVSLASKKKRGEDPIPQLSIEDLELVINGSRIDIRYADRLCKVMEEKLPLEPDAATVATITPDTAERALEEIPTSRGAYLFYFEHSHLTMEGQENALVMAEEMIPKLVGQGTRGMVVSSGRELLKSDLTDDPDKLLDFLHDVRHNPLQWGEVAYAEGEWNRYADILGMQTFDVGIDPGASVRGGASSESTRSVLAPDLGSHRSRGADTSMMTVLGNAQRRARNYAREEYLRTNRQLRRFATVLSSFAELDPPKAALYFADIIRKNAGQHYAVVFAGPDSPTSKRALSDENFALAAANTDAAMAELAFDKATEQAAAHGIRLYTIRSRGLELGVSPMARGGSYVRPNQQPMLDRGMRDADETMIAFALESGGASFRGGTESSTINKVLNRIHADLSCFYLLSFYPDGLPDDSLLPVRVRFDVDSPRYAELNDAWRLTSRGQLMVQSETKRKEAALLAAYSSPGSTGSEIGSSVLIPLGFTGNRYQVLAQFSVNSPPLPEGLSPSTSWDLGMSLVTGNKVRQHASSRLEVGAVGIPVVLEAMWKLAPGPGEVVSVGYENRFGQLAAADLDTDWPDPNDTAASITPIAVLQPANGVFLRVDSTGEEQQRTDGALAVGDDAAQLDRPIYFVGLICRGKRSRDLWIDRKLVGNVAVDFGLQSWSGDDKDRCVQIRDLIRPGQAGWGDFEYVVRVYDDEKMEGEPLAERVREFTGL